MSGMSPEREAEIRAALDAPNIELKGGPYEAILSVAAMADDLLREVDRLRLASAHLYEVATGELLHIYEGRCPDQWQPDDRDLSCDACAALLNPTESDES